MLITYRAIYQVVMLLLKALYWVTPKLKAGYLMRQPNAQGHLPWLLPSNTHLTGAFWFHCSSGEFEYAQPIIKRLKTLQPKTPIIVSYYTPSYRKRIEECPWVDASFPSPWDTPKHMKKFLSCYQPRHLFLARTDYWAEMLYQAHKHGIPISVVSMTLAKKLTGIKALFLNKLFPWISHFFVVSEEDKQNLSKSALAKNLKAPIIVAGDTRYEQCMNRLQEPTPTDLKATLTHSLSSPTQKPLFVAGSTWPEDESELLKALPELIKSYSLVLVPHEHSHLKALLQKMNHQHIQTQTYSELLKTKSSWDSSKVLVVDKFGVLAHIYKYSQAAFIGGSFKKRVHSVMEALCTGNHVIVGPYHLNNREAQQFQKVLIKNTPAVAAVANATDLQEQSLRLSTEWTEEHSKELVNKMTDLTFATKKIIEHLDFTKL